MPARLYAFVPEEQNLSNAEREQLIEGLERELDEYYEQKCGKGSLETYLIQNEIWHLSEINYQVRSGYQKYLREYYVDSTVRNYLLGSCKVAADHRKCADLKRKVECTESSGSAP